MAAWEYYLFDVDKPEVDLAPIEANRGPLEFRVSMNVSLLLSLYGHLPEEPTEVDNGEANEFDSSLSFYCLEFSPYTLEDDSELIIGQIPHSSLEGFIASPGVHAISHVDEDDVLIADIVVFDSAMLCDGPYVVDHAGDQLPLNQLHELVAATQVLIEWCQEFEVIPNDPPILTYEMPKRVADSDFDNVISGF